MTETTRDKLLGWLQVAAIFLMGALLAADKGPFHAVKVFATVAVACWAVTLLVRASRP